MSYSWVITEDDIGRLPGVVLVKPSGLGENLGRSKEYKGMIAIWNKDPSECDHKDNLENVMDPGITTGVRQAWIVAPVLG